MNDSSSNSLVVPLLIGILIVLLAIGGYLISLPPSSGTPAETATTTPPGGQNAQTIQMTEPTGNQPTVVTGSSAKPLPTCKITTHSTTVISANETITFSWTSTNASIIRADKAVDPYGTILPPEGTASVVAREGLTVSSPAVTSPDQIKFRFEAANKTGLGTCWLILPYKPS